MCRGGVWTLMAWGVISYKKKLHSKHNFNQDLVIVCTCQLDMIRKMSLIWTFLSKRSCLAVTHKIGLLLGFLKGFFFKWKYPQMILGFSLQERPQGIIHMKIASTCFLKPPPSNFFLIAQLYMEASYSRFPLEGRDVPHVYFPGLSPPPYGNSWSKNFWIKPHTMLSWSVQA